MASTCSQHSLWRSMPGKQRGTCGPVCTCGPTTRPLRVAASLGANHLLFSSRAAAVACELSSNGHRPHLWPVTQTSGVLPGAAFTTSASRTAWISGHTWRVGGERLGEGVEGMRAHTLEQTHLNRTPATRHAAALEAAAC